VDGDKQANQGCGPAKCPGRGVNLRHGGAYMDASRVAREICAVLRRSRLLSYIRP